MNDAKRNLRKLFLSLRPVKRTLAEMLSAEVHIGRHPGSLSAGSLVFFPVLSNRLCCGLAGIVAFKRKTHAPTGADLDAFERTVAGMASRTLDACDAAGMNLAAAYLGGVETVNELLQSVRGFKQGSRFHDLFCDPEKQERITRLTGQLKTLIDAEVRNLAARIGRLDAPTAEQVTQRLEDLKDVAWCLAQEITANIDRIAELAPVADRPAAVKADHLRVLKNVNAVMNSIDRLEVRGRDSAGMSLMFVLDAGVYDRLLQLLTADGLLEEFEKRAVREVLLNRDIHVHRVTGNGQDPAVAVTFVYKVAAEIGRLGDNIRFLRDQLKTDAVFKHVVALPHRFHTATSHTRWASVGAITEANCHPVDNTPAAGCESSAGIIHVCLNGDIDNYLDLKARHEKIGIRFHGDITTDTKIIPLQVEHYLRQGLPVSEAFRCAVNDFEGSHAISMHTDLAPGKLFLAQKGSGQSIFIGLADHHYMPTSEVYGFVEETSAYLKMDGEKSVPGKQGTTRGQIFILNQDTEGGLDGIEAMYYDGTPLVLLPADIKHTAITSRDIDRQAFPHYFMKEISESPLSVERTLQNRWKIKETDGRVQYSVELTEAEVPTRLRQALSADGEAGGIRRIFFVGQGTAGIAARACADILGAYLDDRALQIRAMKASELSGFTLKERDDEGSMADALVIAISKSGTTTDTNRTVDMVRQRGAHTLAIVNRRDSDITFKVDGVIYTSSGRDIEMSVASTKAFYSQIVAGAILGLFIAVLQGRRDAAFVTHEIQHLLQLPDHMRTVLAGHERIGKSARRLANTRTYWAAVGSGPNKAAADEIRIKLSELCYKTISSDFVEDKKHIDLSSEPLIIVCAAGTRGTVIGDVIKDTAIFRAHKAAPVVIADAGEDRFAAYAEDVFHVPVVPEQLAPVLNTLVGHIWGYYAALAINDASRFFYKYQTVMQKTIDTFIAGGMDVYEILLERTFKTRVLNFYKAFRRMREKSRLPAIMGIDTASDLTLLLKYLAGRLPVSDFELDFGVKGTPLNMLNALFTCLGNAINAMARPIDAIKHQAKTVTVGTSRISEKLEGLLFDTLAAYDFSASRLTPANTIVLRNLQGIVSEIRGAIRYRIGNLSPLGEPTEETTITVERKEGVLKPIVSRVETDPKLKGTKKIIVREGNVYLGKGRKDDRSILVIPVISNKPETPNVIENLLLLNIGFKDPVALTTKVKALGGKYERIKNIVQENSIAWNDEHLELVAMDDLFGRSAEKIADSIVSRVG
jgi:glucosamine--fructose-6-phosphate aminotransferase (isomerizing)